MNNSNIMLKYLLTLILLIFYFQGITQERLPFEKVNNFYIKGGSTVSGNTILKSKGDRPFKDLKQINDEFEMQYIDIDDDASTFSSSSALLTIPDGSNIVYAGLYWSGTYTYEKSKLQKRGDKVIFKGKNERSEDFNQIKFKTPETTYQNLEGDILYDGSLSNAHSSNMPYVCYKNVTSLLKDKTSINGFYTIANIKATQGFISGGSSAGWMLYVVYESEEAKSKYITTHHGFEYINNKNPIEIAFKNFETNIEGKTNTSITIAALDGDLELYRDQCAIWNSQKRSYIPLENELRKKHNFFNSTISKNGVVNTQRNPPAKNTLGFDIAEMNIENTNNELIANGARELKFRYTTKADRYYLFFTAFETEINEDYYRLRINSSDIVSNTNDVDTPQKDIPREEIKEVVNEEKIDNETLPEEKVITTPPVNKVATIDQNEPKEESIISDERPQKLSNKRATRLDGIAPGYYLVTNVFSKPRLAENWKSFLEREGHIPQMIINPQNGWFYVYIAHKNNAKDIVVELDKASQKDYLKDIWVFKINID